MCFAPQQRTLFRHLNVKKWSEPVSFLHFRLGNVLSATTAEISWNFQKWSEPGALYFLTWKCTSRHKGVLFFNISASKSGPNLVCFVYFDLEMCFGPQWCALFRHLNFQKWSEPGVLCIFWLGNVLRATMVCTFSTAQLQKAVRTWGVFSFLTSKCASRHNGVHFFDISTSKSGPNLVCFVYFDLEMCFAPQWCALFRQLNFKKRSEREVFLAFLLRNVLRATTVCNFSSATNHWKKHTESRLPYLCAHLHLLSSHSSQLCFSIRPYCRKIDF